MNISITFRHMDASEAIKGYAHDKLAKLQKFLRKPMTAKVTLSLDKLRHVAEARISSGGEHLEAKETSEDMYASIDRVLDKLERQVRGSKGAARAKKRRGGASLRAPARIEVAARTSSDGAGARRRTPAARASASAKKKSR
jgi:putative sigma-54 modulation protein